MKFQNGSKRFLTLNPNNSEGFTLVELIVVIAIIAILAGVAVPAYSGYIEKANKQADQTLASEISHALQLQYYAAPQQFSGLTYVVLTDAEEDGILTDDPYAIAAMEAAFGSEWKSQGLSYASWEPTMSKAGYNAGTTVLGSTYISDIGVTQLLTDVQKCTDGLTNFMNTALGDAESAKNTLSAKLNSEAFETILSDANFASGELTADALANATVFAVADYTTNADNKENVTNYFTSMEVWYDYSIKDTDTMIYDMASWYAATEALVKAVDPEGKTSCTTYLNQITESGAAGNIAVLNASINALKNEVETYCVEGSDFEAALNSFFETQGAQDAEAYVAVMNTVNNSKADYTNKSSLLDANLMTSSNLVSDLNSYVAGAQLSEILKDSENETIRKVANGTYEGSSAIVYLIVDENGLPTGLTDMKDAG